MTWQQKGKWWCSMSCILFLIALAFLVAFSIIGDFWSATTVYKGDCSVAGTVNSRIHIAVTIYSTLVAISSDFFLRLVVAPQPHDVQAAHKEAQWVDVGINSLRNLRFIPAVRRGLWLLCVISSVPLQLFSQASVYSTATSTDYIQLLVSEGFTEGKRFAFPGAACLMTSGVWRDDQAILGPLFQNYQSDVGESRWHRLDSLQCQQMYLGSKNGLQYYRNLVIVIEAGPDVNAAGWTNDQIWDGALPPFFNTSNSGYSPDTTKSLWSFSTWCSVGNNVGKTWNICSGDFGHYVELFPRTWSPLDPWKYQWLQSTFGTSGVELFPSFNLSYNNITALYCLAEPFESPCKVQVANLLLLAVCICMFLKSLFAITTLILLRDSKPIQCLGDAIRWFLEHRRGDQATQNLCTFGQSEFTSFKWQEKPDTSIQMRPRWMRPRWTGRPREWAHITKTWGMAIPLSTWYATYLPILAVILFALLGLAIGIRHNSFLGEGLLSEAGWGTDPNNSRFNPVYGDPFRTSLVANFPQLVLSSAFFTFSSLYSALFQAREWANFAEKPQRLRVTDPEGGQESSYLLHIPIMWGTMFICVSATLHWLVSQSFYVTASEVLPSYSKDTLAEPLSFHVAYSTQALLLTLIVASIAVLIPVGLSLLPLPKESIIVGTNSAAISAQCHPILTIRASEGDAIEQRGGDSPHQAELDTRQAADADGAQPASQIAGVENTEQVEGETAQPPEHSDDIELEILDGRSGNLFLWLHRLKWGVLKTGAEAIGSPGHLGLGSEMSVVGIPQEGHYYA